MSVTTITKTPKHLKTAIKIAEANDMYPKWSFGAVLIKGGALRSVGMNKLHTHASIASDEHLSDLSTHAEEDALRRCGNPRGATLYIARVGRNGLPALAKPCSTCEPMLREARVKRVVYSIGPREYGVLNL